jgi:hypothetical protein
MTMQQRFDGSDAGIDLHGLLLLNLPYHTLHEWSISAGTPVMRCYLYS